MRIRFAKTLVALVAALALATPQVAAASGASPGASPVTTTFENFTFTSGDLYVVGNQPALGDWNPAQAVPMSRSTWPTWQVTVDLHATSGTQPLEYKYIAKAADGTVTWEATPNRVRFADTWQSPVTYQDRFGEYNESNASFVWFNVHAPSGSADQVLVVGNVPELGSWDPAHGLAMDGNSGYGPSNVDWKALGYLPPSTTIEYKYVKVLADGTVVWESGGNRTLTTPAWYGQSTSTSDRWRD